MDPHRKIWFCGCKYQRPHRTMAVWIQACLWNPNLCHCSIYRDHMQFLLEKIQMFARFTPWCCRSPKKMNNHSHSDTTLSSPSCESVDMEDAMERLDFNAMKPDTQEENHYTNPTKQLQDAMKSINDSAANRARAAHETNSFHQRNEWDICVRFLIWDNFYFSCVFTSCIISYLYIILRFSIYILVSHSQTIVV